MMIEFGQQNSDVIMLLHGGGLSWWNYRKIATALKQDYHVVLPLLDGHAGSAKQFTTIEDNAARIIDYIDIHFDSHVMAIGGLSLGGQIVLEILTQRPDICRFALIESAPVRPMKLTHALIAPAFGMSYGLMKQHWFARLQAAYLGIPQAMFDDYYRDTCKIKKADMIAFLKANSAYSMKPGLSETTATVTIAAGSREQNSVLASAQMLHEAIPGSMLEILPGMRHGDLSINNPEQYVRLLTDLIG